MKVVLNPRKSGKVSTLLKDMTDEQLINEFNGLNEMIEVSGCYSVRDMVIRDTVASILVERGFEPHGSCRVEWFKEEVDD